MFVGHLMTEEGKTMTLYSVKSTFSVNINILDYFQIKKLIKSFTSDFKDENSLKIPYPNCPFHLQILLKQKGMYRILLYFSKFKTAHSATM